MPRVVTGNRIEPHQRSAAADFDFPGINGRGPTKLMSPTKMLYSCGSSSTAVARSRRPTRVTR
jgi:hypothetical protein